jgi:hypothetical protein
MGNRNVEKKRGRAGDVVAEMTFDRKLHTLLRPSNPTVLSPLQATVPFPKHVLFQGETNRSVFSADDIDHLSRECAID